MKFSFNFKYDLSGKFSEHFYLLNKRRLNGRSINKIYEICVLRIE